jgi:hypothetical protein
MIVIQIIVVVVMAIVTGITMTVFVVVVFCPFLHPFFLLFLHLSDSFRPFTRAVLPVKGLTMNSGCASAL